MPAEPDDWSPAEVAAIVSDYLAMLGHELRGEAYNKREHNRRLQRALNFRSAGAIEFKHANISAVLLGLDFPYIEGYKPRANYQELLRREVVLRLGVDDAVLRAAAAAVNTEAREAPLVRHLSDVLVEAPGREPGSDRVLDRESSAGAPGLGINYLEREARNASLGRRGEAFVMELEHRRLWEAGARRLADRIEHVSHTRGDSLGYDIASFDQDGAERLIEVKTTSFGMMTPFFASKREVAVSEQCAEQYRLYRVFKFGVQPKLFVLPGALRDRCILDAIQYRATIA